MSLPHTKHPSFTTPIFLFASARWTNYSLWPLHYEMQNEMQKHHTFLLIKIRLHISLDVMILNWNLFSSEMEYIAQVANPFTLEWATGLSGTRPNHSVVYIVVPAVWTLFLLPSLPKHHLIITLGRRIMCIVGMYPRQGKDGEILFWCLMQYVCVHGTLVMITCLSASLTQATT